MTTSSWQPLAADVRGMALPCGHCIPDEAPHVLLEQAMPFLLAASGQADGG